MLIVGTHRLTSKRHHRRRQPPTWQTALPLISGGHPARQREALWSRPHWILATRLFPTPPLPFSERWTLPALISIPSFGAKVRFLLSDQFQIGRASCRERV